MKKRRLIIIDGHALMHRAWHALPLLTTKDGTVVSGVYGFVMILLKALKELQPTHIAVTFDLAGPTFRHEEYKEYKATREKKPDELYAQFPIAEKILEAMQIRVFTAKGFEADDIIGTIVQKVSEIKDLEVIVVTGDKDTLQLVSEQTKVYALRKGITDTIIYDEAEVLEKMGIRPDQLVDFKALRGDPSDNITGVKGIGEKTAVTLLKDFNSLLELYQAVENNDDRINDKLRQKLVDGKESALLSQHLCEIKRDIQIDFKLDDTKYEPVKREMVCDIFEQYQFLKLLSQLPSSNQDEKLISQQVSFLEPNRQMTTQSVDPFQEAKKMFQTFRKAKEIAFRSLSTELERYIAFDDGHTQIVLNSQIISQLHDEIREFFSDTQHKFICHDLKAELKNLMALGVSPKENFFDLMIASYLLHAGERRHNLETILSFYRNVQPSEKSQEETQLLSRLRLEISHFISLADELATQLIKQQLTSVNEEIELPLTTVLFHLEQNGIKVDTAHLKELATEIKQKIKHLKNKIYKLADSEFNINSPGQLKEILFDHLHISSAGLKKTAKGGTLSTAASELEKLKGQHEIIEHVLDFRELTKLLSTYIEAIPPLVDSTTGRIHTEFNQTITATGRLSSSNPNLQNIPTSQTEYGKKVRDTFTAAQGCILLAADYSQIELRIAAHIADEPAMIEAFRRGEDIHWRTAAEMFGEERAKDSRRIAKAINFGILYGMGAQRLALSADIPLAEAREYIETYFALHTKIDEYIRKTKQQVATQGFVETIFGRRRFFPNFHLLNPRERAEAERQAINMPIQGTSADLIKKAMITLDKKLGQDYGFEVSSSVKMILQVHDELVFEVKESLVDEVSPLIRQTMENVVELSAPIIVDVSIGKTWGSMEKLK